jgi:saccharopine dehydrogenase (NAD+, L-lysine-forming)
MTGLWQGEGVFNVEQLPAEPFLEEVAKQGLPWHAVKIDPQTYRDLFSVRT